MIPIVAQGLIAVAIQAASWTGYYVYEDSKSKAVDIIAQEEGFRAKAYKDDLGYLTIGHGFLLSKNTKIDPKDIVVNLDEDLSKTLLQYRVDRLNKELSTGRHASVYNSLKQKQKDILISMGYQLGIKGLYDFKKMWKALADGNKQAIVEEALDSRWYKQTPKRAMRHAIALSGIKERDT